MLQHFFLTIKGQQAPILCPKSAQMTRGFNSHPIFPSFPHSPSHFPWCGACGWGFPFTLPLSLCPCPSRSPSRAHEPSPNPLNCLFCLPSRCLLRFICLGVRIGSSSSKLHLIRFHSASCHGPHQNPQPGPPPCLSLLAALQLSQFPSCRIANC